MLHGHTFAIAELSPRGAKERLRTRSARMLTCGWWLGMDEVAECASAIADGLQPAAFCRPSLPLAGPPPAVGSGGLYIRTYVRTQGCTFV